MAKAVCIQCGTPKRTSVSVCRECGYGPRGDIDAMARSHILSLDGCPDDIDCREYVKKLDLIAARLRAGEPLAFDQAEVDRISSYIKKVQQETWWDNLKLGARAMLWLAPLWAIIALAVILLLWS